MTEFTVKHACGHEVTHRFDGPESQRATRQKWLREQPCQVCWRERQTEDATAQGRDLGLPALEGDSDEIAWAETLRAKAMPHNLDFYKRVARKTSDELEADPAREAVYDAADKAIEELRSQTSAAWWIENRFDLLNYVRKATVTAVTPILNAQDD